MGRNETHALVKHLRGRGREGHRFFESDAMLAARQEVASSAGVLLPRTCTLSRSLSGPDMTAVQISSMLDNVSVTVCWDATGAVEVFNRLSYVTRATGTEGGAVACVGVRSGAVGLDWTGLYTWPDVSRDPCSASFFRRSSARSLAASRARL